MTETAYVWNARIDQPVAEDYDPGKRGWIGCRMETMNVNSWSPDSRHIAFVSNTGKK